MYSGVTGSVNIALTHLTIPKRRLAGFESGFAYLSYGFLRTRPKGTKASFPSVNSLSFKLSCEKKKLNKKTKHPLSFLRKKCKSCGCAQAFICLSTLSGGTLARNKSVQSLQSNLAEKKKKKQVKEMDYHIMLS